MNAAHNQTPDPVGQQAPPMRVAPSRVWMALRNAHGSLLWTTGTACGALDERKKR